MKKKTDRNNIEVSISQNFGYYGYTTGLSSFPNVVPNKDVIVGISPFRY